MESYRQELNKLLETVAEQGASDLHLNVGSRPLLRVDGELVPLRDKPVLTPEHAEQLVFSVLSEEQKRIFLEKKELDLSYALGEKARFRVNAFHEKGFKAAALRLIPSNVKTIEDLGLPPILHDFIAHSQGFLLITGPTGHGKSTTLAALIDEINHTRSENIITIEDPIEYLFLPDRSVISQREIGEDTKDFHSALRAVFREDVDVVMVGEMRDPETMSTAVTAAETGHLILATLHTNSAAQTIDRIVDSFPPSAQNQIRGQLANTLLGIVSQRLIPRVDGGRVPAVEVLISNSATRNLIREGKTHQIDLVIETSLEQGMISLNRSLAELVRSRVISMEQAEIYSLNSQELKMLMEK